MSLNKMQQMRREKKYHNCAATERQGQIADGFSQFNNESNNFCMCRHGIIQVYRLLQYQYRSSCGKRRSVSYLLDKVSEACRNCNLIEVDFSNQP